MYYISIIIKNIFITIINLFHCAHSLPLYKSIEWMNKLMIFSIPFPRCMTRRLPCTFIAFKESVPSVSFNQHRQGSTVSGSHDNNRLCAITYLKCVISLFIRHFLKTRLSFMLKACNISRNILICNNFKVFVKCLVT